ncbi:MAG TPA: Fic family protein [Accumulibacter sp.]|uniref:Fic family protein n=1 Tax=Accumulibacter sp. TaxID=2053492 RepID=UPI0025D65243|nr:Fic family protein [Accumulibacter sp.]MCM8599271.1 Fic family protein [Accumulibacter sp.]MCM8663432.1 Fic family protein [Accumulibacter sp.]HNC51543.1 Fic family protein [Accumulibacter sp.]
MAHAPIARYTQAHQFEPLLPQSGLEDLRRRSRDVVEQSYRLSSSAHGVTIASLRELLRAMNSYYSNRIEGQSTHPRNIERALRRDFSDKPDVARMQRLALAHIEAERELESRVQAGDVPLTAAFVRKAHAALYGRLAESDRVTANNRLIVPGGLRHQQVAVGRHEPPPPEALPTFLERYDQVYGCPVTLDDLFFTVAAAHQRMAWIHPFLDGNGRASRLQTHCALFCLSGGLWSVSRGLARQRDAYYAHLDAADGPRQGDLDGRGNLSEKMLREWCAWFIGLCEDQVSFMARMLNLDNMKTRIQALVIFRAAHDKKIRHEAIVPLYHLFLAGPTSRGEFQQMTGLGERTARSLLSRLIETGLVASDGHTAPVRFAFPLDALQFILPELYPEAATSSDSAVESGG